MADFSNITCPEGGCNFCIIRYIFIYFSNTTNGEPNNLKPKEKDLRSGGVAMFLFFFNFTYIKNKNKKFEVCKFGNIPMDLEPGLSGSLLPHWEDSIPCGASR